MITEWDHIEARFRMPELPRKHQALVYAILYPDVLKIGMTERLRERWYEGSRCDRSPSGWEFDRPQIAEGVFFAYVANRQEARLIEKNIILACRPAAYLPAHEHLDRHVVESLLRRHFTNGFPINGILPLARAVDLRAKKSSVK